MQPDEEFELGDAVVIIGPAGPVAAAVEFLGRRAAKHLANDRSAVDYRRILISNPMIAGRTIGSLDIPHRYDGIITRVRRGDTELLAYDDLVVELGDRLRVVVPRGQLSGRRALPRRLRAQGQRDRRVQPGNRPGAGLAVGLIALSLPGGIRLSLGAAAGPLVVGMVLGRLERTGPIVWGLPNSANLTIRQLGLLLFLAATGLASGQAFASQAFTLLGLRIVLAGVMLVLVAGRRHDAGRPAARCQPGAGRRALSGFIGQPAILAYGNSRVDDERLGAGFTALFAIGMIAKVLLVQVIVGL